MGLQYGKGLAEEALRLLSSPSDPITRLLKGWSEIEVATHEDAHPEEYARIKEWKKQYLDSKVSQNDWRDVENNEDLFVTCRKLSEELVSICCDMIERNAKNKSE